jgi:hypothetical protein
LRIISPKAEGEVTLIEMCFEPSLKEICAIGQEKWGRGVKSFRIEMYQLQV